MAGWGRNVSRFPPFVCDVGYQLVSTLWTPEGERPVRSEQPVTDAPADATQPTEPTDEEMRAELAEVQRQLAETPASVVVANHCIGLYQLAALHLGLDPPQLDQAQLAIDALAAL